jgi:5-methylcytosine-specific restriction endonuclease McrA
MHATPESYKAYMRKYMLKKYYKVRNAAIEKLGGSCSVCGEKENLEFDHINPALKEYEIADIWVGNKERFWKEIDKCQLLCEKHHIEKTKIDNSGPRKRVYGETVSSSAFNR